jgi:hypothetical protein
MDQTRAAKNGIRLRRPKSLPINARLHRNIPKDANGDPIFLILPPELRPRYEARMAQFQRGWNASRDPAFVTEAHKWAHLHRQPSPQWLDEAVWILAANRRTAEHAKRADERAAHFMRYQAVRDVKGPGVSWEQATERAAEILAGTGAEGEPKTMWESYKLVKRDLREGRGDLYIRPKPQRRDGVLSYGPVPKPRQRKSRVRRARRRIA